MRANDASRSRNSSTVSANAVATNRVEINAPVIECLDCSCQREPVYRIGRLERCFGHAVGLPIKFKAIDNSSASDISLIAIVTAFRSVLVQFQSSLRKLPEPSSACQDGFPKLPKISGARVNRCHTDDVDFCAHGCPIQVVQKWMMIAWCQGHLEKFSARRKKPAE
jgi:hypothetical protein